MFRHLDLFTGFGGFAYGLEATGGFQTVAMCEISRECRPVLERHFPRAARFRAIQYLEGRKLANFLPIHLATAGFPCQDASVANIAGAGTKGARTGLFEHAVRLAGYLECGLLMENVPGLLVRGFGDVLRALAEIGFDAEWECISARDAGADHERERLWIMAYPGGEGRKGFEHYHGVLSRARTALAQHGDEAFSGWRALVSGQSVLRGGDGISVAMERRRLHGLGNAVCPSIPQAIGQAILEKAGWSLGNAAANQAKTFAVGRRMKPIYP